MLDNQFNLVSLYFCLIKNTQLSMRYQWNALASKSIYSTLHSSLNDSNNLNVAIFYSIMFSFRNLCAKNILNCIKARGKLIIILIHNWLPIFNAFILCLFKFNLLVFWNKTSCIMIFQANGKKQNCKDMLCYVNIIYHQVLFKIPMEYCFVEEDSQCTDLSACYSKD